MIGRATRGRARIGTAALVRRPSLQKASVKEGATSRLPNYITPVVDLDPHNPDFMGKGHLSDEDVLFKEEK